jgi:hypothetical protein
MGRRTNIDDYIGKRYGRLVVIGEADTQVKGKQFKVKCACDCGNVIETRLYALKDGNTKSCGCLYIDDRGVYGHKNTVDMTGQKYGRLTVISKHGPSTNGLKWNCLCECGNQCVVAGIKLRNGEQKSCGCSKYEPNSLEARIKQSAAIRGIDIENWKGFSYEDDLGKLRLSLPYNQWRDAVLKRDGRVCQRCGCASDDLRVHHLNSYTDFPEQRFDIDNGITLCAECHDNIYPNSFHRIYWTHHNTREQFEEWMANSNVEEQGA